MSFTSDQAPCAVTAMPMDAGSAWAYARHEAGRLTGHAVVPEARPRLAEPADRLPPSWQAITVLGQMDGRASVRELAWRNGLALYAVMDWVARLIQHGACTVTSPAAETGPAATADPAATAGPAATADPAATAGPAPTADPAATAHPLPGRTPSPGPFWPAADIVWSPPDRSLLGRVLSGLRQLVLMAAAGPAVAPSPVWPAGPSPRWPRATTRAPTP